VRVCGTTGRTWLVGLLRWQTTPGVQPVPILPSAGLFVADLVSIGMIRRRKKYLPLIVG
jgi:hypothetical protein